MTLTHAIQHRHLPDNFSKKQIAPLFQQADDAKELILETLFDQLRADISDAGQIEDAAKRSIALSKALADFKNLYGRTPQQLIHWAGHAAKRVPAEKQFHSAINDVLSRAKRKVIAALTSPLQPHTSS